MGKMLKKDKKNRNLKIIFPSIEQGGWTSHSLMGTILD